MDADCVLPGVRGGTSMIVYLANGGNERITFSTQAIAHMLRHRQLRAGDAEAGGQLFASLSEGRVDIEVATGPRPADRRSRFYFAPSRIYERREIRELHRRGLHYVGDWHTHPQLVPSPSNIDLRNIRDIFTRSRHAYGGILMVIVGQLDPPTGMFVGIADAQNVSQLFHTAPDQPDDDDSFSASS